MQKRNEAGKFVSNKVEIPASFDNEEVARAVAEFQAKQAASGVELKPGPAKRTIKNRVA